MRAGLVALAVLAGCVDVRPTSVSAGSVRIRRVTLIESREPVEGLHARAGDWVMKSRSLRVLVGGDARGSAERGAILEVRTQGTSDEESLVTLAPSAHVGRRRFPVEVDSMEAVVRGGRARLRLTGHVDAGDGKKYLYSRELTLSPRLPAIGIASKIGIATGRSTARLGARIAWGGRDPWLPGVGTIESEDWHDASFVGVEGTATGSLYAQRDVPVRVGAQFERHGSERFLQLTEVVGPSAPLVHGRPIRERAYFVVAPRGLAEAVRRLGWVRGAPFSEASARMPYAPPGSAVRVLLADGTPLLSARPDANGEVVMPLPPIVDRPRDDYVAIGTARGHAGGERVPFHVGAAIVVDLPRGGRVRVRARDASSRHPLTARVRLLPQARGATLDLGPDWSAEGARDAIVLAHGEATVPLPPGRYRVLVSHGPEWTLHDQIVEVTDTFRPDVLASLVHVVDPGPWIGCDLHVHASPSPDSQVTLEDRIASLVAEGIGFAVPTDHNEVTDYAPIARRIGLGENVFLTTSGVEATTNDPSFGHFNAYPVPLDPAAPGGGAPPWAKTTPAALFASMRALGPDVTIQVNHPRLEGGIGYFDVAGYDGASGRASGVYSDDYDVLEVWNGFDLARKPAFDALFGEWLLMVARGRHVAAVGSSDSHLVRYQWAGYPRTYARAPDRSPLAIVDAIRHGRSFVTSGPFLEASIGEVGPGELAAVTSGVARVHLRVRTPPWMTVDRVEVWKNGARVLDEPIPQRRRPRSGLDVQMSLEVPVVADTALVVLVRGSTPLDDFFGRAMIPPLAFTNPIWIDANGDGLGPSDPRDVSSPADAGVPDAATP